jgi:hypothetical protein
MKKLITAMTLFVALTINAQITRESKSSTKELYRGAYSVNLTQFVIEVDTSYALYFQNRNYTTITDLHYISFKKKSDVVEFLQIALEVIEGESQYIKVGKQSIFLSKTSKGAYIGTQSAYLVLSRKEIENILNSLN